jgi:hypothetical protein
MGLTTDIIDWALDANGDIAIGQDVSWTTSLAAVVQSCRIALQMIRGEWFLNDSEGVPYWERSGVPAADALLGQPYNQLKATAAFRAALLDVPEVITILALTVSLDKTLRKLSVTWTVRTTFGDTAPETTGAGGI